MEPMNATPRPAGRLFRHVQVHPDIALRVVDHHPGADEHDAGRPVVVMLHGLSSNALMWDGVAAELTAAGFRSIAIDQRGHGHSDKPDGPYDMTTVTDDLARLLDAEGIERPVLAGQSWGANVVMEYAARFPGQVAGVVPVDGGFIDLAASFATWEECAAVMAPPRLAGTPARRLHAMLRASHPDWSLAAIESMMEFVEVDEEGLASPRLSFENHMRVLHGLWEHRPQERYRTVVDPVWWVVAEPPPDAQNWAARKRPALAAVEAILPRTRSTWIVGDHDLHAQFPDRVANVVIEATTEGYFA